MHRNNLNTYIGQDKYVLVTFYQKNNKQSKKFLPTIEKLNTKFKSIKSNLIVATVEVTENITIPRIFNLKDDFSYPRTFIFSPHSTDTKHEFKDKNRTYLALIKWITNVVPTESVEVSKFLEHELNSDLQTEIKEVLKLDINLLKTQLEFLNLKFNQIQTDFLKEKEIILKINQVPLETFFEQDIINPSGDERKYWDFFGKLFSVLKEYLQSFKFSYEGLIIFILIISIIILGVIVLIKIRGSSFKKSVI